MTSLDKDNSCQKNKILLPLVIFVTWLMQSYPHIRSMGVIHFRYNPHGNRNMIISMKKKMTKKANAMLLRYFIFMTIFMTTVNFIYQYNHEKNHKIHENKKFHGIYNPMEVRHEHHTFFSHSPLTHTLFLLYKLRLNSTSFTLQHHYK